MQGQSPLILDFAGFSKRLDSFLEQANQSSSVKNNMIQNPVGTLSQVALPGSPPPDNATLSEANRLLFSLLSNPHFMSWAQQYEQSFDSAFQSYMQSGMSEEDAAKKVGADLNPGKLLQDLSNAAAQFGDPALVNALKKPQLQGQSPSQGQPQGNVIRTLPRVWAVEDIAVSAEVVAVIVGVVFAVVVAGAQRKSITRADLQATANSLVSSLEDHAKQLRQNGKL